jgi:AraC family transcriptional regulator
VIYREMPPVWDPSFRTRFYARWGQENAVISATARRAEYADFEQLLSIKAAFGGVEEYFIDGRRVTVDDDTFLILNAGRRYGSRIHALRPVHSFSIFFRSGLAEEVLGVLRQRSETLLDSPLPSGSLLKTEFDERLREHDGLTTPALTSIKRSLECDEPDELRLDEQLHMLLGRMLDTEHQLCKRSDVIPSAKPATRRELHRRLGLAKTFMHTRFREAIGLREMATAAHLSPFHFLRLFKIAFGITPSAFLNRKRTMEAQRLIRHSGWTMTEIAINVGFGSRTSLFRHLKAYGGTALLETRKSRRRHRGSLQIPVTPEKIGRA